MNRIRFPAALASILAATALLATSPLPAAAQSPAGPGTVPKTVGRPQPPRVVPSMIVLNARGAKLDGGKLVLEGVSPNAIIFADRPVRSAGHALTAHLLDEWTVKSPDSFYKTPPNATVSVLMKGKNSVVDAVMVLKAPKLEGERLTFDVDVLEGDLAGGDGAASVFMDIINLPTARHTGHRAAWYHGAN
ncbi:hypothetical protein [Reyranella sp.]|uniref:hypothetical protein n=1 Tax=Reyranella sp. TaxID=1929291 RepID=UPI003BAAB123